MSKKNKGLYCSVPAISTVQISWPYEERDCSILSADPSATLPGVRPLANTVVFYINEEHRLTPHHARRFAMATLIAGDEAQYTAELAGREPDYTAWNEWFSKRKWPYFIMGKKRVSLLVYPKEGRVIIDQHVPDDFPGEPCLSHYTARQVATVLLLAAGVADVQRIAKTGKPYDRCCDNLCEDAGRCLL